MPGKIVYSFAEMAADLAAMTAAMARDGFRPDVIAGITRGGLPPAVMLSHYFAAPLVTINWTTRDGMARDMHAGCANVAARVAAGEQVLIVDDILDSGRTLADIAADLGARLDDITGWQQRVRVAVLWHNLAQPLVPDYAGRTLSRDEDDRWIVFPYEDWWSDASGEDKIVRI